ncbi:MAG: universal stress protein [Planctomycetes bacterium]|nr:universal stress protein [Planctomycetota bacterium]
MNSFPQLPTPRVLLAGVDADGLGDHALDSALRLEKDLGARLLLVHAVGTAALDWEVVEDPRQTAQQTGILDQATRVMLQHVRERLRANGENGGRAEELLRVFPGPPARVLLEQAREFDADLILLGTHKRRGWIDFGSTVRAVLARAPKSVWLQSAPAAPVRSILCPVDLSHESLLALAQACALAHRWQARVTVLHVFQPSHYLLSTWPEYPDMGMPLALSEMRDSERTAFTRALEAFDWRGVPHELRSVEGEPHECVLDLAHAHDLVVMGTHGRTGLASALLGNVAYSVMRRCEKPVLAIRHPERRFLT